MWFHTVPREHALAWLQISASLIGCKERNDTQTCRQNVFVYFAWLCELLLIPAWPFEAASPTGNNQIVQRMDFIDAFRWSYCRDCYYYKLWYLCRRIISLVATQSICVSRSPPSVSIFLTQIANSTKGLLRSLGPLWSILMVSVGRITVRQSNSCSVLQNELDYSANFNIGNIASVLSRIRWTQNDVCISSYQSIVGFCLFCFVVVYQWRCVHGCAIDHMTMLFVVVL